MPKIVTQEEKDKRAFLKMEQSLTVDTLTAIREFQALGRTREEAIKEVREIFTQTLNAWSKE